MNAEPRVTTDVRQPQDVQQPRRQGGVLGFNVLTAAVLALVGFLIGWWIGGRIGTHIDSVAATGQNDVALLLGYVLATIGWLIGLGFLNYPVSRMLGRRAERATHAATGLGRYFRATTDHKVVGLQYLVGVGVFFFIGGLNAMLIRAQLLLPDSHLFPPGQYLTIVTLHGTMMIMMMSAVILGPFGNYFVPLMIGAKGMAFPRVEALTFWLLPMAGLILLSAMFVGGISTGWTGYPTLAIQAQMGMDSYIVAFALVAISLILVGINMIVTIVNLRAPGLTWNRLPIFVWSVLTTSVLMVLGAPMLITGLFMEALDRTASTSFYLPATGGSPFLYENLFWFFGHPEVYILALPGFGVVLEILPVFARKPLWGYRLAVAGMFGVSLLSFMVWQHHLFVSGINSDLRPFYMLTTELISVPTGFIFLVAMGTLWRARIRYTVPMLFAVAFFFNFLVGGISGVFLSDVPSDVTLHGSYFVMAHFHYTIMGGLVFAFFAGTYYWLPKMTGRRFNETLAKIHFWGMFVFFNATFLPLFVVGMLGMPRRVSTYAPHLQALNDWVSISAFCLGCFMLVFLANLLWSQVIAPLPAEANPWASRGLEWQLPTPVPDENFAEVPTILSGPYEYGVPDAPPVVSLPRAVPVEVPGA
jgi:cytochrome c oxidase subunit 1